MKRKLHLKTIINDIRRLALPILLLLISLSSMGQDVDVTAIKRDPKYVYGESEIWSTPREARLEAVEKMLGELSSQMERSFVADNHGGKHDFALKSYYNVILDDFLNVIELSPAPKAKVFVYIEKSKVRSMFSDRQKKAQSLVEQGQRSESRLNIDDALRNYYWALMLAKSLHEDYYLEVTFGDNHGDARSLLPEKIRSVFRQLDCKVVDTGVNSFGDRTLVLRFTYNGVPVSSLRYYYHDGSYEQGLVIVRDGYGEASLREIPIDNKLQIRYEYRFEKEAIGLMPGILENIQPVSIKEATWSYPLGDVPAPKMSRKEKKQAVATTASEIKPEKAALYPRTRQDTVNSTSYKEVMTFIENAIAGGKPLLAYPYMTEECYALFKRLLTETGKVSLDKKRQHYQFVVDSSDGMILCHWLRCQLKVGSGKSQKTYMEKLVFRFSPIDNKIHSFAFGLSEQAEADIFSEYKSWPNVSRYTILKFMEDYQTAFALKRTDYIESIFSEDALIIVGSVLKKKPKTIDDGKLSGTLSNKNVEYKRLSKGQYIANLKSMMRRNEYVHLVLEDNTTKELNTAGRYPDGSFFGIQIGQLHESTTYSDYGYLTLLLNMTGATPIIEVRYWQPERENGRYVENFQKEKIGDIFNADNIKFY